MGPADMRRVTAAAAVVIAVLIAAPSGPAMAHPLGNFTVNHLNTLTVEPNRLIDDVVVDAAEIPSAQRRADVDTDGNGDVTVAERQAHADNECSVFAESVSGTADSAPLAFEVVEASFVYVEGQAGLESSRLQCRLVADFTRSVGDGGPTRIEFVERYEPGRVGWREINAIGVGVGLVDPPVPSSSVTDGLSSYPEDLLESPLDVREVVLNISPDISPGAAPDDGDNATEARDSLVASRPSVLGGFVERVQDTFDDMLGRDDLTLGVGLLAVGLALVLGASHALLPGHGKTVMAAYIAGRQGSARDAVLVGATVTATHTGGVLLLGLGLTISTALAGETVLSWLGVISGLMIAALGVALLVSAARRREPALFGHGHVHGPGGHTHGPAEHALRRAVAVGARGANTAEQAGDTLVEHDHHDHHDHCDHEHQHGHGDHDHGDHDHGHDHGDHGHGHEHDHEHGDHGDHGHDHHGHGTARVSRRGLVGMGVAGGLVPSPSALIVLLSAIALGRTWFGVLLVIAYGAGMAIVLTLAGIMLVKVRDRYEERIESANGRVAGTLRRWGLLAPYLTAALVLVVGLGLAVRSFTAL
jgi:nickel/cobalt transporter (NicO) family protein